MSVTVIDSVGMAEGIAVNGIEEVESALLLTAKHIITTLLAGHDGDDDTNTEHAFPTIDAANDNEPDLLMQY